MLSGAFYIPIAVVYTPALMKTKAICLSILLPVCLTDGLITPGYGQEPAPAKSLTLSLNLVRDSRFNRFQEASAKAQDLFYKQQWQALDQYIATEEKARDGAGGDLGISGVTIPDKIWLSLKDARKNDDFEKQLAAVALWQKALPDSPYPRVMKGMVLNKYAWFARGSGWANTVTEEGQKLMEERLNLSKVELNKVPESKRPFQWYLEMQRVALGLGFEKQDAEALFNSAIKAYPNQIGHYKSRTYALLPRWYGEDKEWEKFARNCADKVGGTAGDVLYARIVWYIHKDFEDEIISANPDMTRFERGLNELGKKYSDQITPQAELAKMYLTLGDKKKAAKLISDLGNNVPMIVFESKSEFLECKKELAK